MSKPETTAAFKPEVPGLSYYLPEPREAEAKKPASQPLTALEQMFDYFS